MWKKLFFYSPGQKVLSPQSSTSGRPLSLPRERLVVNGGSKFTAYKPLQEVDCKKDKDAHKWSRKEKDCHYSDLCQDTFLDIQTSESTPSLCRSSIIPSVRRPHLEPSFSSYSVPIIPSLHCHYDIELSRLHTDKPASARPTCLSCSSASACEQQVEVALLLEEAQAQLKALAHCKHRKPPRSFLDANETKCFLNPNLESPDVSYDPLRNIQTHSHSKRDFDSSSQ
ncbi:hypothetical protein WMY93_018406 [Mugilogobius chulae]|uniref:Uncharacterized protein n=1 Tax=Mugilogobius chulae TaxID=88201 RepID=A0AAW0NU48_9GOBI